MFVRHAINRSISSLCICCACFWIAPACALGQDTNARASASAVVSSQHPRIRFVSSSQAEVFAGPGEDFYPTAVLKSGQSIEVHQETADGWLAITPPPGSFSWLPASHGLLLPGGRVVEVTEKSAVSWIGTSLGTAKQYRWQVKVERGQQMAVVGEQTINSPESGSQALWYKIAPPAGEYRWIQTKATSEQAPATASGSNVAASTSDASVLTDEHNSQPKNDSQVVQATAEQPLLANQGKRQQSKNGSGRGMPHQHNDPWAQWHAVEFKNGTFSFPGLSRMLGLPPVGTGTPQSSGNDPFDLTASYSRPKSARSGSAEGPVADQLVSGPDDQLASEPTTSQMAVRQSRGWRDPRQLRDERMRGGQRDNQGNLDNQMELDEPTDTALAANEMSNDDAEVMDASFRSGAEIGTSVIAAGGAEPRRLRGAASESARQDSDGASEQAWYGIDQAPTSQIAGPISVGQANLDELQLELSAMVAGPEHRWNLAPLAERARYFVEHGRNSLERGQARLLLERIESFATIANHSSALGMSTSQASAPTRAIPASASTASGATSGTTSSVVPASAASWVAPQSNAPGVAAAEANGSKFDATGWLVPVHSSGRDMPTHALTNDTGRIIVYVTPAPGVNLTRFESQAIGVFGLRGYLPQLKSNHIQIQRVVRLQ